MTPTNNSLTNEQIARVFAMYLGRPGLFGRNGFTQKTKLTSINTDVSAIAWDCECWNAKYGLQTIRIDEFKLLLTPLSAISNEDAVVVARLAMYHRQLIEEGRGFNDMLEEPDIDIEDREWTPDFLNIPVTHNCFEGFVHICLDGSVYVADENDEGEQYVPAGGMITQYLTQKGYAVPLFIEVGHPDNGKTAIQLGLAIDKTEQP